MKPVCMARSFAAGLSPIDSEGEGLLTALAAHFSSQFKNVRRPLAFSPNHHTPDPGALNAKAKNAATARNANATR